MSERHQKLLTMAEAVQWMIWMGAGIAPNAWTQDAAVTSMKMADGYAHEHAEYVAAAASAAEIVTLTIEHMAHLEAEFDAYQKAVKRC
jgi:hypothetical protein